MAYGRKRIDIILYCYGSLYILLEEFDVSEMKEEENVVIHGAVYINACYDIIGYAARPT